MRLDFYTYTGSRGKRFGFTNYTGDKFFCSDRYFRYELILFGLVFNLQLYK